MAKIIGIDLGTTNSCVAVMEGNEPVVIPNSEGPFLPGLSAKITPWAQLPGRSYGEILSLC